MNKEDQQLVSILAIILILLSIIVIGAMYGLVRPSCYGRWKDSGTEVRWSFWGDCQIHRTNGTWVNDNYYLFLDKNSNAQESQ